uniref:G-protein coupled receptors family 1 profile domain-containing protein n=1 Tax=Ictidomys tridecemlineatus TaxID=43179 RepID=A0A287CY15_ICTTR
ISFPECFAQIYAIHSFMCMESGIFLCMALDRYIAICYPLQYPSIITEAFVIKAILSMVLRNGLLTIPVPILAAQRHYYFKNEIDHCMCSNLGVTSLACDDITINRLYQLSLAWLVVGSDMILVFASYALIVHSVLKLNSAEATSKALSTCTERRIPLIPVLLNVLHIVIPPSLNPMVYALRTQELRVSFQRVLGLSEYVSRK